MINSVAEINTHLINKFIDAQLTREKRIDRKDLQTSNGSLRPLVSE